MLSLALQNHHGWSTVSFNITKEPNISLQHLARSIICGEMKMKVFSCELFVVHQLLQQQEDLGIFLFSFSADSENRMVFNHIIESQ